MAPRYWIGVVHQAQARAAQAAGLIALSHGKEAAAKTLSPGDQVLSYALKGDFLRPLLDHLSFAKPPFRCRQFEISESDFNLIAEGMGLS